MGTSTLTNQQDGIDKQQQPPKLQHEHDYKLPNDALELSRLDAQAAALSDIMHGKVVHAQLDKPARILDIGCGTGAVTRELAAAYPDAEVVGVDLSPVWHVEYAAPNTTFVLGNIKDLAGAHPLLAPGSFDLVFSRFLIYGMRDWPAHLARCATLVRPGGQLELHEPNIQFIEAATGEIPVASRDGLRELHAACAARGMDLLIGERAAALVRDAGLDVLRVERYALPYGPWMADQTGDERFRRYGDNWVAKTVPANVQAARAMLAHSYQGPELERLVGCIAREMGVVPGRWADCFVTVARKPL